MKHIVVILGAVLAALLVAYIIADKVHAPEVSFDDQEKSEEERSVSHPDIIVESLRVGETITSPLTVSGKARGVWFFEAVFPIVVVDWDGRIIGEGYAQAQGEWMTEDFVPFSGTVTFTTPEYGERGAVIFRKDNPSGLPEHDDALEIPVTFELNK